MVWAPDRVRISDVKWRSETKFSIFVRESQRMKTAIRAAAAVAALLTCAAGLWPAAPGEPNNFRFAIVGDRTGEAQPGVYEKVWREIDRSHPDFAINAGTSSRSEEHASE